MKTIGKIDNFPLYLISVFLLLIVILPCVAYSTSDRRVWNGVIKHSDEFVLDHAGDSYAKFKLYDKDSTCVCSVLLSMADERASVWNEGTLIGSSFNRRKSKKAFNLLYEKIPVEKRPAYHSKEEVIEYFKHKDK
jgi:hypothetical protein